MNVPISLIVKVSVFDVIENLLYLLGAIFAILLIVLCISAYRNTGLKKLLYAVSAFSLFGIFLLFEYLEHALSLDNAFTDLVASSMGLVILILFFLAVVKKT